MPEVPDNSNRLTSRLDAIYDRVGSVSAQQGVLDAKMQNLLYVAAETQRRTDNILTKHEERFAAIEKRLEDHDERIDDNAGFRRAVHLAVAGLLLVATAIGSIISLRDRLIP